VRRFKPDLPTQILIGLGLGVIAGFLFKENILWVRPFGQAFIRLITMIVVPLVFASLLVGTASIGDPKRLGRIGGKTLLFFLITTIISSVIGLTLANIFKPGSDLPPETRELLIERYSLTSQIGEQQTLEAPSLSDQLINIIPSNPVRAMTDATMLQIIFFAMFLGVTLTLLPEERSKLILGFFNGLNDAMIKMVMIIMKVAPIGVFALIAVIIGDFGYEILVSLSFFTAITIAGFLIQMFTVYPLALKFLTHMKVSDFFKGIKPAQLIAFSTTSSGATLPINMECCEDNLKLPKNICSFVLPLGATINMNGTSLYQGIAALFIASVMGIQVSFLTQVNIVVIATLAAIGTAGVPGASIIMLAVVLTQLNIPLEMIALVLGVDRIIDMFRTTLNITGDAICAVYVTHSENSTGDELPDATPKTE
jgi:Na+/H+-dicarboxylate symporter